MNYKYILILAFVALLASDIALSQKASEKMKLAQSFEKGGDLKNAERLYRELFETNPAIDEYFNGIIRCNKQLNQFQEIIPLVEKYIKTHSTAANHSLLGELYWRTGKPSEANDEWQKALDLDPANDQAYQDVALSQSNLRLWPKAIATYQSARKKINNNQIFSNELSQLYSVTGDYKNGIAEVMNIYTSTRNIQFVQGRIAALNQSIDAGNYIFKILEEKASSGEVDYMRLLTWYLTTMGKFNEALLKTKTIDAALRARGNEVYSFAGTMQRDGKYEIAIKAYEYIIDMGKESPVTVNALYGLTRSLELSQNDTTLLSQEATESIISRYRKIIKDYPQSTLAEDSRMRIATLFYNMQNYKNALEELNKVLSSKNYSRIIASANNLTARIFVETDDLTQASNYYMKVVQLYKNFSEDDYINALYGLADIEYFKGNQDSAIALFTDITIKTSSDKANDALERISNIEQFKKYNKGFELFIKAELKNEQKKYPESVNLYNEAADAAANTELSEKSLMIASELEAKMKHIDKAREFLLKILAENPDTYNGDYILFNIGQYFYMEGKKLEALNKFNELLAKYPRSIYLNQSRELIRQIRLIAN